MRPCRGGRGGGCRSALASEEAPTAEALGAEAAIHQSPTEGDEALDEGELAAALGAQAGADAGAAADAGVSPVAVSYSGLSAPIVRAEVALASDGRPEAVVGSFAEGGMAFAVQPDGTAMLVAVAPGAWSEGIEAAAGSAPEGAPGPAAGAEGAASGADAPSALAIPASVEHAGATYEVAAIGAHALSLCEADEVAIPASVSAIDQDALWPTAAQRVEVDPANPTYASHDGILCDASLTRLLSIPGGREGAVRIPDKMEVVDASVFSHCAGVDAISVDAGGAAFSSWDGLLYDASGATLLRVPAGATDVTIRDGCTTIAAGALEGCTSLERIEAPASVSSISPDAFASVPTVELPAASSLAEPSSDGAAASDSHQGEGSAGNQIASLVALSSAEGGLPEVDPSAIEVTLPDGGAPCWSQMGFALSHDGPIAAAQSAASFAATTLCYGVYANDGAVQVTYDLNTTYDAGKQYSMVGYGSMGAKGYFYLYADGTFILYASDTAGTSYISQTHGYVTNDYGLAFRGWTRDLEAGYQFSSNSVPINATTNNNYYVWPVWYDAFSVTLDACAPGFEPQVVTATFNKDLPTVTVPARAAHAFLGYFDEAGTQYYDSEGAGVRAWDKASDATLYAKWELADYDLSFDTSSEPGDEGYPGIEKPDQTVTGGQIESADKVEIEDPKRPGYVFQGWVIPNAGGTEAIDQDLVYQGDDGKWYVDASKLPDYADGDGRVELTARWTSVVSVDVPSRVTFLADVVTQGQNSRDGLVQGAFAQAKAVNRSEVDLRIVGLEATAAGSGDGALGADAILRQAADATPASSAQKLLSVYPSDDLPTSDELKDPTRVSSLPDGAVGFDLGDTLLEAAFDPEAFAIPAGGQLSLGYRLNLAETAIELDYDALSSLDPGQSAQIATVSYTFAADYGPVFWTVGDDGEVLGLEAIRRDAAAIASGDAGVLARYSRWMQEGRLFHLKWYDQGVQEAADPLAATVYDVRIIGVAHDQRADGSGAAPLTFQLVNGLDQVHPMSVSKVNAGGWAASDLRAEMNEEAGAILSQAPAAFREALVAVSKGAFTGPMGLGAALGSTDDVLFVPSFTEVSESGFPSGWAGLSAEGSLYAWWDAQDIHAQADNEAARKGRQSAPGEACSWYLRSAYPTRTNNFVYVNTLGQTWDGYNYDASLPLLVSFCFCL